MIRQLVHDPFFLAMKSAPATQADLPVARDLLDTLIAHKDECVGMAANMIGVRKRIIAVCMGFAQVAMLNPVIVKKQKPYEAEEGCLSLAGVRKTTRYEEIEVTYLDLNMKPCRQRFTGFTAQVIQHEVDHCDGILI